MLIIQSLGDENMNTEKIAGILYLIVGLLFIIYPLLSSAVYSVILGLYLLCFGISALFLGFTLDKTDNYFKYMSIIIGIISIIFGICFMILLNALPFLVSLQFYIIGILLMAYGLIGIPYLDRKYRLRSIAIFILGILIVLLAFFAATQPVLIAVIIGVLFIVEGIFIIVIEDSLSLATKYE